MSVWHGWLCSHTCQRGSDPYSPHGLLARHQPAITCFRGGTAAVLQHVYIKAHQQHYRLLCFSTCNDLTPRRNYWVECDSSFFKQSAYWNNNQFRHLGALQNACPFIMCLYMLCSLTKVCVCVCVFSLGSYYKTTDYLTICSKFASTKCRTACRHHQRLHRGVVCGTERLLKQVVAMSRIQNPRPLHSGLLHLFYKQLPMWANGLMEAHDVDISIRRACPWSAVTVNIGIVIVNVCWYYFGVQR